MIQVRKTTPPKNFQSESHPSTSSLKLKREAHELAQKEAGLWGEMSVGYIERQGAAFVHFWKTALPAEVFKITIKKPKDITKTEHEALCGWLKAGRYEGFKQTISAWNLSEAEAERIKESLIAELAAKGTKVINPQA